MDADMVSVDLWIESIEARLVGVAQATGNVHVVEYRIEGIRNDG